MKILTAVIIADPTKTNQQISDALFHLLADSSLLQSIEHLTIHDAHYVPTNASRDCGEIRRCQTPNMGFSQA
jgi:hypothetical protein